MTPDIPNPAPLVAIVTPVYNGARYLREAMEQVQAQTYPNLVHCVLDNASSDETPEIIASFANARVPVITRRNPETVPLCENWNLAHDLVPENAEFMRLICADDGMHPDCTTRMVEKFLTDPEILVVGTNALANGKKHTLWPEGVESIDGKELIRRSFRHETGFLLMHVMMRTSVRDWRKPLYDPFYTICDVDAVLAVLERGKMGCVHDYLSYYREHTQSFTATQTVKKNTHFADWLSLLHRYGPSAYSAAEFKDVVRRYERHYLRQVLRWQKQHGADYAKYHFDRMKQARGNVTTLDYAGALYDWALIKVGLRKHWSGYPF